MTTTIKHVMPSLKETIGANAIESFPNGFRWPLSAVEREAKFAIKAYVGVDKFAVCPSGDYTVEMADYGVVHIVDGIVVRDA